MPALFNGERWDDLAARGATPQRCLWAPTSVTGPSVGDTFYVGELTGPETISTMPEEFVASIDELLGRVDGERRRLAAAAWEQRGRRE